MKKLIYFFLLILLFQSCQKKKQITQPVEFFYEQKKSKLLKTKEKECREKAILDAGSYIDTIIDKIAKKQKLDTIRFPSKPNRPIRPNDVYKDQ